MSVDIGKWRQWIIVNGKVYLSRRGKTNDVEIFEEALTQDEISALYQKGDPSIIRTERKT